MKTGPATEATVERQSEPTADRHTSDRHPADEDYASGGVHMSYGRFTAMIATSTAVMFALMYINTFEWDHVRWSETRFYMALLMGATMAAIMLAFMLGMYKNIKVNIGIGIATDAHGNMDK